MTTTKRFFHSFYSFICFTGSTYCNMETGTYRKYYICGNWICHEPVYFYVELSQEPYSHRYVFCYCSDENFPVHRYGSSVYYKSFFEEEGSYKRRITQSHYNPSRLAEPSQRPYNYSGACNRVKNFTIAYFNLLF